MTPKQSKKAGELSHKIARNEAVLKSLAKSSAAIEAQKKPSTLVKLSYLSKDEIVYEIVIDPQWFYSAKLRADFQYCVKVAKDGFIELLEKDLRFMKEELNKLI